MEKDNRRKGSVSRGGGADEDGGLIVRVKKGDYSAFETLVRKYENRVYNHCYKFLNNQEDAEDILQETFLQVYKSLDTFRGEAAFTTWMLKIATNNCLMKLRKKKKMNVISIDKPIDFEGSQMPREIEDWSRNPSIQYGNDEIGALLDKAIAQLPEDKRIVLVLKDVEGFSNIEISKMLGVSVAAVKSRLHRSRLFIRNMLSKYFEDAGKPVRSGSEK